MKSTSRIHHNPNGKPPKTQVQTVTGKVRIQPPEPGIKDGAYSGSEPITLTIFDAEADAVIAGVDITPSQLKAFQRLAAQQSRSLSELLRAALDHLLKLVPAGPTFGPLGEVDAARAQSAALGSLLADSLNAEENMYGDEIAWGIRELLQETDDRLSRAIESLCHQTRRNQQEVAA